MYVFAVVATHGTVAEGAARAIAGTRPAGDAPQWVATPQCILGGRAHRAVSIASQGHLHAAFAGEILGTAGLDAAASCPPNNAAASAPPNNAAVLLALYARFGEQAFAQINGLFCALVWDEREQCLTAASDRVGGFHSLYHTRLGDSLIVCSRLQALLAAPGISRELRPAGLHELFATGYVLPPETLLRGVRQLGPGEVLRARGSEITTRVRDRVATEPIAGRPAVGAHDLEAVIAGGIRRAQALGGERAYLLSGGVDSSTVAAIATRSESPRLRAYTGAFPGTALDESEHARRVARHLDCEHVVVDLGGARLLDCLPLIVWHLGLPMCDFSVVPTYHLLRRVGEQSTVVVSGDGPDHLLCRYAPLAAKRALAPWTAWIPRLPRRLMSVAGLSMLEKVRRAGARDLLAAYRILYTIPTWGLHGDLPGRLFPDFPREGLAATDYLAERRFRRSRRLEDLLADLTYIDLYVDGSSGVFNKVGAMARAAGVTLREPYLDREVADWILRLPFAQRLRGSWPRLLAARARTKYLLKYELAPRLLPPEITRKVKGGFTPPLSGWLRERLGGMPDDRWLCAPLRRSGILAPDAVQQLVGEHRAGLRNWDRVLFLLLSFDLWYRMTIERLEVDEPAWTLRDLDV